ncbi:EF-hand domain-containing protein [Ruegeria sediminis]|nr:EF-hand domain-containing protein [Ruegeria sediminis]
MALLLVQPLLAGNHAREGIASHDVLEENLEMRRVAVGAMVAALFAAPAFASVSDIDTDGEILASFAEMVVIYSDLTEETFAEIDTSGDSFLDEAELAAAVEAGVLTADQ